MTTLLPDRVLSVIRRPWPLSARLLGGAAVGVAIVWWGADERGPWWRTLLAVGAMLAAAVGGRATATIDTLGGPSLLAFGSALALYSNLPENDRIVGVGVGLSVLVLGELIGRARCDATMVVALVGALVWGVLQGAAARDAATVAGFASLGLLVLWPLVARVPGPRRGVVPYAAAAVAVPVIHTVGMVAIGRRGTTGDSVGAAIGFAVGVNVLVVLGARLVVGARRR